MVLFSITITIFYLLLIGAFVLGFDRVKAFKLEDISVKTSFSVVIPFRNEAKDLPDLLRSISRFQYPKHLFEVILVDDDSEDNSIEIVKFHSNTISNIKVIKNNRTTNSPKKDAITTAIKLAKNDWIITTDADCILPKYWLDSFDACIQKTNAKCIVAPVTYSYSSNFLGIFQLLDFLSLQGATLGGFGINKPFLCNGANFGYRKSIFKQLNGFKGNTNIASGDDIFLLEKAVKTYGKDVRYLKCDQAVVSTLPQDSWRALIGQRLRWASKTSAYNNWFGKLTGIVVLLMNILLISIAVLTGLEVLNRGVFLYILIIKFSIDFLLIYKSAVFFNQKKVLKHFFVGFLVYPFFSTYVALISTFTSFKWKGRTFKK